MTFASRLPVDAPPIQYQLMGNSSLSETNELGGVDHFSEPIR